MNRIPVALFNERAGAEELGSRLRQAGVPAEIHDELRLEKLWFASKSSTGVRLEVPANQFERSAQLLIDWDIAGGALHGAIRCPECHSFRVHYPQFARHSLFTNLALGFLSTSGLIDKEYYCEDCHFTWPREGSRPRRARPHLAPHYFIEGIEQTSKHAAPEKPEQRKAA
jgi:hypothetical protein